MDTLYTCIYCGGQIHEPFPGDDFVHVDTEKVNCPGFYEFVATITP